MRSVSELSKMPLAEVERVVGVVWLNSVVQPPLCVECGGECAVVDVGEPYLQCMECGHWAPQVEFGDLGEVVRL